MVRQKIYLFSIASFAAAIVAGCATIKIEAPDKPIEINLNVKIEQELRIKLDREIENLIADNPDIFG
jgi:YnbE-like lipoprotein